VKREMIWESPWGAGFPGWHIECSAMSKRYLGVPFDIHTGGIDHIPVHHENELAQTEGAEGLLEANVWMHNEFITMEGGKMSKSLGNLYTISDLIEKGYDPLAYRYLVLGAHYRSKLNFTFEALDGAQNALNRLRETVRSWGTEGAGGTKGTEDLEARFLTAVNDDLNTPQALAIVWELVGDAHISIKEKAAAVSKFDRVLGLGLDEYIGKTVEVPAEVQKLVDDRETARLSKNWAESDRLRDEIIKRGFSIEDTPSGPKILGGM